MVLTYNDSRKDLHKLCQIPRNCQCNDFRLPARLKELLQALFCFLRSFRFTWVRLYPLSSQVLYHHSVSMTMSRLTSLTDDIVIRSYLITKFFRSGQYSTGACSARSPRNFRPQADVAIPSIVLVVEAFPLVPCTSAIIFLCRDLNRRSRCHYQSVCWLEQWVRLLCKYRSPCSCLTSTAFLTHIWDCSVDTGLIERNDCAKNSFNRITIGSEVYR